MIVVMVMTGMTKGEEGERRYEGEKGRGREYLVEVTAHGTGDKGFAEG